MTISKGAPWGEPFGGDTPPVARTDADVARLVAAGHLRVALAGGDLHRTVGGAGRFATIAPIDLGYALVDGVEHCFAAHLVARRRWWPGRIVAVMNAEFIGDRDVAPRSHPNDGRLDVLDATLSFADRWKAYRRLRTGLHVPHPRIDERRVKELTVSFAAPIPVWIDGTNIGEATEIVVRCEPDKIEVVF